MDDIDVYVNCHYNLREYDSLLSSTNTALVWAYIKSSQRFHDSLNSLFSMVEKAISISSQIPDNLRIDACFEEDELTVELALYTVANCTMKLEKYSMVFDDINEKTDTAKQGWIAREAILKEIDTLKIEDLIFYFQQCLALCLWVELVAMVPAICPAFPQQ